MKWIIIVPLLALFVLGYFLMDRLDKFLASPRVIHEHPTPEKYLNQKALVFGRLDLSDEIIEILEKLDISYLKISEFKELNSSSSFEYLFAVDESDFENLMICSFCEKMMDIHKRVAICNSFDTLKIFKDNHIPILYGYSINAQALVAELIPSYKEIGGKDDA